METSTTTKNIEKLRADIESKLVKKAKHSRLITALKKYAAVGNKIDIKILRSKLKTELGETYLSEELIRDRRNERI